MRAMVRPRRTSMERTRAGAATVTEGWAIGAGATGAPEIAGLVAGLAAGGIVIHDRSSRTGVGEFCGWTVVGEADFSTAPVTEASAASVEMTIRGLGGRKSNDD